MPNITCNDTRLNQLQFVLLYICGLEDQNDSLIKENTEIVILNLFPQCPISLYIFDNTLPCKLPEDRQSNFTQVWKVMGNDIIQQLSCPGSAPWFMTTTESES